MKEVLGPGSKILAVQDFRHTSQEETESVSVFVRRLECTFRVAYGADKLGPKTRAAFLYGQLQEGLKYNLMRSPNVFGALTYKELVVAAKNEEKRQAELEKRNSTRTLQRHKQVLLHLRLAKLAPVPLALSPRAQVEVPGFVTIATNQDTGNAIAAIESDLRAVAGVLIRKDNPLLPLTLILRLYRLHCLPQPNMQLWILYHYCTPHQMRARMIRFVLYESMTVVANHTMQKFNSKEFRHKVSLPI